MRFGVAAYIIGPISALLPVTAAVQNPDPLDDGFRPAVSTSGVPSNVWVTSALAKVPPGAKPGIVQFADISAARNEFESFQVHVRASDKPIQLNVAVSDFVGSRTRDRIAANPNVSVLREGYIKITTVSDQNGITGLVPDPLIPGTDPYFHERRNGFPVEIPSNQTRSAWIDVYVPQKTPSGYYLATITVNDGPQVLANLPVRLKVWDFDLPSTATLKSAYGLGYATFASAVYGSRDNFTKYPGSKGSGERAIALMHVAISAFFLDHRVSISAAAVHPTYTNADWRDFDDLYGPLLDGRAKTALPGARLTALDYPNLFPVLTPSDVKDWTAHFKSKGWLPRLIAYICDEPPAGCPWEKIRERASVYHANGPGLKTLVTTNIANANKNGLLDAIDILTPVLEHVQPRDAPSKRPSYDEWLKGPGKELWWYQACGEHESCDDGKPGGMKSTWASYMVDASPVRNRVFQWMAFLYNVQGELYYGTDIWGDNPWDHLYYAGGNGDGALFYPGAPAQIGGQTPIPVASMRLKLIRDGMEDYEYLAALAKAGDTKLATETVLSFITNGYTFKDDPAALFQAREKLGTALHRHALGTRRP